MEKNDNPNKLYFLIGAGCGVAGTLLLAPRLKEVREEIAGAMFLIGRKFGTEIRDDVVGRAYDALQDITNEIAHTGRKMANTVLEETKERLVIGSERFSEAIEVGKQAYLEEKHKAEQAE
jgi:hypothetical protein